MDAIDSLLTRVAPQLPDPGPSTACPSVELLADFSQDRLAPAHRPSLETHLATCAVCLGVVEMQDVLLSEPPMQAIPAAVFERAAALVSAPPGEWRVALKRLRAGFQVLLGGEELLSSRLVPVRAGAEAAASEQYTFEHQLPAFVARLTVQAQGDDAVSVTLSLSRDGAPASHVQVELWQAQRLLGLRQVVEGAATFNRVLPGDYRLMMMEKGQPVGQLLLALPV